MTVNVSSTTTFTVAFSGVRRSAGSTQYIFGEYDVLSIFFLSTNIMRVRSLTAGLDASPAIAALGDGDRFAAVFSFDLAAETATCVVNNTAGTFALSSGQTPVTWANVALASRVASSASNAIVADMDFFAIYPGALDAGDVYDALFDPVTHALRGQPGAVPPGVLADVSFFRVSGEPPSAFAQNRGTTGGAGTIAGGTLGEPA